MYRFLTTSYSPSLIKQAFLNCEKSANRSKAVLETKCSNVNNNESP